MSINESDAHKGDIQIIDDTPVNLEILASILTKKGYDVRMAISGELALKSVRLHPPDLILLDIMMPGMSGYEVCEALKTDEQTRDIPVIFISALDDLTDKVKGFSVGGADYITKPFQDEEVLARVKTHLALRNMQKRLEEKNLRLQKEIDERKRAEEKLRKLSRAVEQSASSIVITDLDGTIEYVNPAFSETTGYSYEEAVGNNPRVLKSGEHPPKFYEEMWRSLSSGNVWQGELVNRQKDGKRYWESATISPVKDQEGKITHYLAIKDNITRRKKTEEKLLASEKKYRELVQSANSIILRVTPEWKITFLNDFAQDFFAYTEDEILDRNVVGTIVPETESTGRDLAALIDDIAQYPDKYRYNENENMRSDGERVWVAWSNKVVKDKDGRIVELLCIGNDITERRKAEAELVRREANLATLVRIQQHLLDPEWEDDNYADILEKLGRIADVSRSYMFENSRDLGGHLLMSQTAEWCAPGIESQIGNPDLQNLPYDELPYWAEVLGRGDIINGLAGNIPEPERGILKSQNILSILVMPLTFNGEFSGFIGFDDCVRFREWESLETSLLQSAAAAISLAMEKQQAENALKESHKIFAAVMNSIDAVIYVADMETYKILFVNQFSRGIFGDAEGKICWQTIQTGQDGPCEFCSNKHLVKDGRPTGIYRREFQNTVTRRWYQMHGQAIRWTDGRLVRLEVATDIEEFKQAEEALQKSNDELKARVDELAVLNRISRTMTMTSDLHTDMETMVRETGRLLDVRGAGIALFDAMSRKLTVVAHFTTVEDETSLVNFEMPETLLTEQITVKGESLVIPDAQTSILLEPIRDLIRIRGIESLMFVPLKVAGKVSGAIFLSTARKDRVFTPSDVKLVETVAGHIAAAIENIRLFEEAEKARKEAENANRAKSEFLANMSHEIRTPMNAVLGFTELLDGQIADPQQKEWLEAVKAGGKNLLCLINDILDLSKVEAGKMEICPEPTSLVRLANELGLIFQNGIEQKGLSFIVETEPDIPENLLLDEVRLRQTLFNLIGNAVKFTDEGYVRLTMKTGPPSDSPDRGGRLDILITVEDTGIGIPETERETIFDPFIQQKGQQSAKYGGTGLGLAITKRLVEMMNGTISVKSAADRGSIFRIYLKSVEIVGKFGTAETPEGSAEICTRFEAATIMVVDDIDFNRVLIKSLLRDTPLSVTEVSKGEEALNLLGIQQDEDISQSANLKPDLILMDLRMPGRSGYEVTEIIKNNDKCSHIPVIAVSASAMMETEKKVTRLFDGYIRKPLSKAILISELKKYLPCTVVEATPASPEESGKEPRESLSPETISMFPELIRILENEFLPKWEDTQETLIFDEIEEFSIQARMQGAEYGCALLISWSDTVMKQMRQFDMENLSATFEKFPELIKKIRIIAENKETSP